uniref:Uncharacterized protein n=1 Tax=Rhizophora mucronata TaxID=61149 RepID=A0A2P2MXB4_RHIMU
MLNLSLTQHVRPRPQGNQFDTLQNNSYYGNFGLCGAPLSRTCDEPQSTPSIDHRQGTGLAGNLYCSDIDVEQRSEWLWVILHLSQEDQNGC